MAIEDEVAKTLSDGWVKKINFQLGPLLVNAAKLQDVVKAIRASKIKVVVESAGGQLSAAYSPSPISKMTLSGEKIVKPTEHSAVVHESIHAVVDISGHKGIGGLNDEAAGYLGESIYLSARNIGPAGLVAEPPAKKIYIAAFALVRSKGMVGK